MADQNELELKWVRNVSWLWNSTGVKGDLLKSEPWKINSCIFNLNTSDIFCPPGVHKLLSMQIKIYKNTVNKYKKQLKKYLGTRLEKYCVLLLSILIS